MKSAQDYLSESNSAHCFGGFNARLQGESFLQATSGFSSGHICGQRAIGWDFADELINKGMIFSETEVDGRRIVFKCFKDGNQWCCVGEGFENLQSSDNFAFGETRDIAIKNFSKHLSLMINI